MPKGNTSEHSVSYADFAHSFTDELKPMNDFVRPTSTATGPRSGQHSISPAPLLNPLAQDIRIEEAQLQQKEVSLAGGLTSSRRPRQQRDRPPSE